MARKQSSPDLSTLASLVLGGYSPSPEETRALAASVLSQDETSAESATSPDPLPDGSGRTLRQLRDAPNRFVYVVSVRGVIPHVRDLINRHFPEKDVTLITVREAETYLKMTSTRLPVIVDHAVSALISDDARVLIER